MKHIFTQALSNAQLTTIWRVARFDGQTQCIACGWSRKFWNLADGRWQCKRCKKKFGWTTDTLLAANTRRKGGHQQHLSTSKVIS